MAARSNSLGSAMTARLKELKTFSIFLIFFLKNNIDLLQSAYQYTSINLKGKGNSLWL
jgi:hypothetical protein